MGNLFCLLFDYYHGIATTKIWGNILFCIAAPNIVDGVCGHEDGTGETQHKTS